MPQNEFYFDNAGEISGPVSASDLPRLGITRKTLIWKMGMEAWQSAESVPDLIDLFQALPPALPTRAVPPPIPVSSSNKPPLVRTKFGVILEMFTGRQYSLPQFGKFKEGNAIFDNEDGNRLVSFDEDELSRYRDDIINYNKSYAISAISEEEELAFILYKPAQTFAVNLIRELHFLDSQKNIIATCRAKGQFSEASSTTKYDDSWVVVYTPTGSTIMHLNLRAVEGITCLIIETVGRELAVVIRSDPNNLRRHFIDKLTDRYDVTFLEEADGLTKCIVFAAVAAFDLFCAERVKKWQ